MKETHFPLSEKDLEKAQKIEVDFAKFYPEAAKKALVAGGGLNGYWLPLSPIVNPGTCVVTIGLPPGITVFSGWISENNTNPPNLPWWGDATFYTSSVQVQNPGGGKNCIMRIVCYLNYANAILAGASIIIG